MNPIKKQNLEKGEDAENRLFNIFKIVFDENLKKDSNQFATFDYYSDETLVELKSRNNKYEDYATTMVGVNKVKYGLKSKKNVYFAFEFTNGLYYWKLNKEELAKYKVKIGGTTKRGALEFNQYLYIPISALKKIKLDGNNPTSPDCVSKSSATKEKLKEIVVAFT